MSDELALMSAVELAAGYRTRRFSPVKVVDAVLARIERVNPRLNAFCTVTADTARREAKAAEAGVLRGERLGPLHGVPVSVKDMVVTKGIRTTFGSAIYADHVPTEDAPMVEALRAAGAIITGKTTTEFGLQGRDPAPAPRRLPQPVEARSQPGRLERRRRGRRRGGLRAAPHRRGRRRLDPHPRELLRRLRAQRLCHVNALAQV